MYRRSIFLWSIFSLFTISAKTYDTINEHIKAHHYTDALKLMETTKMPNITKKRLLIQLAKDWKQLTPHNKKKFDKILTRLMPADQRAIEEIRMRYLELNGTEPDVEEEVVVEQKIETPRPEPKKSKEQPKAKPTAKKMLPNKAAKQQKQKMEQDKRAQALEWNVRDEL